LPHITIYTFSTDDKFGTQSNATADENEANKWAWDWCYDQIEAEEFLLNKGIDFDDEDSDQDISDFIKDQFPDWDDLYPHIGDSQATCCVESNSVFVDMNVVRNMVRTMVLVAEVHHRMGKRLRKHITI